MLPGMPWLKSHDPHVTWSEDSLVLKCGGQHVVIKSESKYRKKVCCLSGSKVPQIQLVSSQKFINDSKGIEMLLFVIRMKSNKTKTATSVADPELQQVLTEYADVLVDGLPQDCHQRGPSTIKFS